MPAETAQRVYDLLAQLPKEGLNAAKRLFWTELNYDRVNQPLSDRNWPDAVRTALAGQPLLFARNESQLGAFEIIFVKLAAQGARWAFLAKYLLAIMNSALARAWRRSNEKSMCGWGSCMNPIDSVKISQNPY